MSEACTGNCSTCGESCGEQQAESLLAQAHPKSKVKKVIAVMSGKGGVGKSTVSALLAVAMQRRGFRTAILDADITGPSIPKAFGVIEPAGSDEDGLYPARSETGIEIMSINLLLENDTDPVVWRGPVIAGAVKQFWSDVVWEDIDFMFVDMPPGTGDVPLTVFQSLPIDGILVVTAPQELVSMVVTKAVKMAGLLNVPILGLIENYSYLLCPDCGKRIAVFGRSHIEQIATSEHLPVLANLPIDPSIANAMDLGLAETVKTDALEPACIILETMLGTQGGSAPRGE